MSTLLRPSPNDPNVSLMENSMELRQMADVDPDMYTNKRNLWHPPGARGLYGGAIIAQCLSAAQATVPADFLIHSMHCYFVLAGSPDMPVIYHVEHVREGKSYATRTVQARQRGKAIFTTTLSFQREGSEGKTTVAHDTPIPRIPPPTEDRSEGLWVGHGPFESQHLVDATATVDEPSDLRTSSWVRCRGRISDLGGHQAHTTALAYMSDSYLISTISRAHRLWRKPVKSSSGAANERIRADNGGTDENVTNRLEIGMMVSLDHTIYFHRPKDFRADEWLYVEMQTPWSGAGRGVAESRIWTRDGKLIASCFQEGVVRVKQSPASKM